MQYSSIGFQLPAFSLQSGLAEVKNVYNKYNKELASGEVSDIPKRLNGDMGILSHIDERISSVNSFESNVSEVKILLEHQDLALDFMTSEIARLKSEYLNTSFESERKFIDNLSTISNDALSAVVDRLNQKIGDRSLFGGLIFDQPALVSSEVILNKLKEITSDASNMGEVQSIVSDWFEGRGKFSESDGGEDFDAHGNFDTVVFLGNSERNIELIVGKNESLDLSVKASDPNIRSAIETLAMITLMSEFDFDGSGEKRKDFFSFGAQKLHAAEGHVIHARAKIGSVQEVAEEFQTAYESESAYFNQARNDIRRVDPYETLVALIESKTQIETIYNLTARLAQLNLADYLR